MTGLPTVQVLLDDASNGGTWPYDITTYVELQYGYTITRGRSDEVGDVQPTSLTMTLNNTDGRFTLGTTGGGYGTINVDRRIQVKHTVSGVTTTRCTLYVQDWPVEWPGGSSAYAVAQITAVDRLARLNRRVLRSIIEQEILLDDPVAYYTLGEPAGSTSATDSSGNSAAALLQAGSGTDVVFGNATGPGTDGLTAAQFAGGKYLEATAGGLPTGTERTVAVAFLTSTTTNPDRMFLAGISTNAKSHALALDTSGNVVGPDVASTGHDYRDGLTHVAVLVNSSTGSSLYIDGALADTGADTGSVTFSMISAGGSTNGFEVGGSLQSSIPLTGVLAHVAAFPTALGSAAAIAICDAMLNGFNTDRSDQRIARFASYTNIPTADQTLEVGYQTGVPHFDITGMSPTAAMSEVVTSEKGLAFLRGDGDLVFQNRYHRSVQTAPVFTVAADAIGPADRFTGDMQHVVNAVTITRADGPGAYVENAASIASHEQYPLSLDLKVATTAEAEDRALWEANAYPEPLPRIGGLTIDLLQQTVAVQQDAQALELSDRLRITGLPTQTPGGTTADLVAEGWTETVSIDGWTMQFNVTPWAPNAVWILGDSTYGALDSTTRLGF